MHLYRIALIMTRAETVVSERNIARVAPFPLKVPEIVTVHVDDEASILVQARTIVFLSRRSCEIYIDCKWE